MRVPRSWASSRWKRSRCIEQHLPPEGFPEEMPAFTAHWDDQWARRARRTRSRTLLSSLSTPYNQLEVGENGTEKRPMSKKSIKSHSPSHSNQLEEVVNGRDEVTGKVWPPLGSSASTHGWADTINSSEWMNETDWWIE